MRIRKRQVPLPISSLIPVPLSDLYFNRSPAALLQHLGGRSGGDRVIVHPQPSDRPGGLIQRESINGCGFRDHDDEEKNEKALRKKKEEDEEDELSDAVTSKNVDSGPETGVPRFPKSPSQVVGRLSHEEEKIIPWKKRRGICGFEEIDNAEMIKAKMQEEKKLEAEEDHDDDDDDDDIDNGAAMILVKGRKKARGGALMEGSRCSRVNGRGWRCCQQTLVGYSLCEHHLGKGRLRSMTNVRNGHKNNYKEKTNSLGSLSLQEENECAAGGRDGRIMAAAGKKRVKLGTVKARSISSLLGQTSSGHHHGEDNDGK